MPILKTYQRPKQAYIDAGYLRSMGIEATVTQDLAYGGVLPGVI